MASQLLNQVRGVIRKKHMSLSTERTYISWIVRYISFCGTVHPSKLDAEDVAAFLTSLAVHEKVAASTQNQAGKGISNRRISNNQYPNAGQATGMILIKGV